MWEVYRLEVVSEGGDDAMDEPHVVHVRRRGRTAILVALLTQGKDKNVQEGKCLSEARYAFG
jgi:hypothetical protein